MAQSYSGNYRTVCVAALKRAALTVALVALATPAMAQSAGPGLVGVWKITGWEAKTAAQVARIYGDHPGGYFLFSPGGHFMFTMVGNNREGLSKGLMTDADMVTLFRTMSALDGTYNVQGSDKFVIHVEHSWNQLWTGTDQHREFAINGNSLSVTFKTKNERTGDDLLVTVSAERAE
jgi:hypothetical protein